MATAAERFGALWYRPRGASAVQLIDDNSSGAPHLQWLRRRPVGAAAATARRAVHGWTTSPEVGRWSATVIAVLAMGCGTPTPGSSAPAVGAPAVSGDEGGSSQDASGGGAQDSPGEGADGRSDRGAEAKSPSTTDGKENPPPLKLSEESLARARKFQPLVRRAAAKHGVDPHFINGIIWHESKFNPRARGPAGARGLMQLMPRTSKSLARRLGRPHRPYDPDFNVDAGTLLLARLLKKFDGDETLALAAYGRGTGRVRGWMERGEPLPEGVMRFVRKVKRGQATFAAAFGDASGGRQVQARATR